MQKKKFNISDVNTCNTFTLSCDIYDQETHTTTTHEIENFGEMATQIIGSKYNERFFYSLSSQPTITPTIAFKNLWDNFKMYSQENLNRMYQGLVGLYYNPIENYEGRTTQTTTHGDITTTYGDITTTIDGGKVKSESTTGEKTDTSTLGATHSDSNNFETTFEDTSTMNPTNRNISTSNEVTNTFTGGSQTNTTTNEQLENGTNKIEHANDKVEHGDDTFTEYKHGNLGLLTSAQALEYEKKIREESFVEWCINLFITENTYYYSSDFE